MAQRYGVVTVPISVRHLEEQLMPNLPIEKIEPTRSPVLDPVQLIPFYEKAISQKYAALGGVRGFLGAAAGAPVADGKGASQRYAGGTIFWSSVAGAHEVHGAILAKYEELGSAGGFLGYPTTDESGTPDGIGRYNHFQNGSIYWTPQTGAHEVHGAIGASWAALGWERGYLGYPVSDEHDGSQTPFPFLTLKGRVSDFQNGSITWTGEYGAMNVPQVVSVNRPDITVDGGVPVGGSAVMLLSSDGHVTFEGHLHDSGFPSYDYLAVFSVKGTDGNAYTCTQSGHLYGTDEPGSRDSSWAQNFQDDRVRQNWAAIRGGQGGSSVTITSDISLDDIEKIVSDIFNVVLRVISLAGGGGDDPSSTSSGADGSSDGG